MTVTVPLTVGVPALVVFVAIVAKEEISVDWLAAVAAPEGRALEATTTAPVLTATILPSMEAREVFPVPWSALVAAPAGKGRATALTG